MYVYIYLLLEAGRGGEGEAEEREGGRARKEYIAELELNKWLSFLY